jgi:hypothetical protein
MGETTTPPDKFLRSLGDRDTHRGITGADDTVAALCNARFTPRLMLQVVGPPPSGQLVGGSPALRVCPSPVGLREF